MTNYQHALDPVFKALADPTRRAVIAQLSRRPTAVSELAQPFDMAMPSFLQHIRLLEQCGLVRSVKQGRVRTCHLVPKTLKQAEDWMTEQRELWERRLNQLDAYALKLKESRK